MENIKENLSSVVHNWTAIAVATMFLFSNTNTVSNEDVANGIENNTDNELTEAFYGKLFSENTLKKIIFSFFSTNPRIKVSKQRILIENEFRPENK